NGSVPEVGPESSTIRVVAEGAAPAALEIDRGRAVYAGAYPSTDVVFAANGTLVEELFVLHDASAPATLAWRVALPASMHVVEGNRAGGLSFSNARGEAILTVLPPFALDAHGARRDAALAWREDESGGVMKIALDTTGLAFPVLLDPAISSG